MSTFKLTALAGLSLCAGTALAFEYDAFADEDDFCRQLNDDQHHGCQETRYSQQCPTTLYQQIKNSEQDKNNKKLEWKYCVRSDAGGESHTTAGWVGYSGTITFDTSEAEEHFQKGKHWVDNIKAHIKTTKSDGWGAASSYAPESTDVYTTVTLSSNQPSKPGTLNKLSFYSKKSSDSVQQADTDLIEMLYPYSNCMSQCGSGNFNDAGYTIYYVASLWSPQQSTQQQH